MPAWPAGSSPSTRAAARWIADPPIRRGAWQRALRRRVRQPNPAPAVERLVAHDEGRPPHVSGEPAPPAAG